MSNKLDRFILRLKPELGLSLKICFGIFLFILFFQPFPLNGTEFNDHLLVISGFILILFIIILFVRIFSSWIFEINKKINEDAIFPAYFNGFVIFLLSATALAFYIHYAGGVEFNFTIAFRIIIICLIAPVVLALHDSFRDLKLRNDVLVDDRKNIQKQVEKFEEDLLNKIIEFTSDNNNESLSLTVSEVIFIKSSDNYVEIAYRELENIRKKLLRNTLKNIEFQIKQYSNFIRCHRTCIVNVHFIEKLHRDSGNQWLSIKGSSEKLPVSRQHLLRIQEAL